MANACIIPTLRGAYRSRPADSIVKAARKEKCELIVMASRGRRGLTRLLLGSETNHVLVHSRIPVLVVH